MRLIDMQIVSFKRGDKALSALYADKIHRRDECMALVSRKGTQILFLHKTLPIHNMRVGRQLVVRTEKLRIDGKWSPDLMQKYAAIVGLTISDPKEFLGLKIDGFDAPYTNLLETMEKASVEIRRAVRR